MRLIKFIIKYFAYCGIEKEEYNILKMDAYISNFRYWRILHVLLAVVFCGLYIGSLMTDLMRANGMHYLAGLIYSVIAGILFFVMKEDSLVAQLFIYLAISVLFIFGCLISLNRPNVPAVTFIVFLLISSMFMIDKPYFMAIELCAASTLFLVWMYYVKPYEIWRLDFANVITFTIVGIFLNIMANSIRIKEFVLTRQLNIQKDTDYLTGLLNKGALTREIDNYMAEGSAGKGIMYVMDVDRFKSINDIYGHDMGDHVIHEMGIFLRSLFDGDEIVGRFGGDEFLVFIKGTDDSDLARRIADDIAGGAAENVKVPDTEHIISVSIGISMYHGDENDYSTVFKRADKALYKAKADPGRRYVICE